MGEPNFVSCTRIVALLLLCVISSIAIADRLPSQVPENQMFQVDTIIDATGIITHETDLHWIIDHQDLQSKNGVVFNSDIEVGGAYPLSPQEISAFESDGIPYTSVINLAGDIVLISIDIPTYMLQDVYCTQGCAAGESYQDFLNFLTWGDWYVSSDKLDSGYIHDGKLRPTEEIGVVTYTESTRTSGGILSITKNFGFDSRDKEKGLYNLQSEKVLTYSGIDGSHLVGSEAISLDIAGNLKPIANSSIRCVFAESSMIFLPAFCNVVNIKSSLVNINSAQISTKASSRAVGRSSDTSGALNYEIAVTPDRISRTGFADGTISTLFGGSIMEARGRSNETSTMNIWKDSSSVTGGIKNFQKMFTYVSGLKL
ncbi:MAG TPA: hypothetical protein VN372_02650 [Methanospirillum sp.]|nr:hypothetical protein [Methanospirillum sp.]